MGSAHVRLAELISNVIKRLYGFSLFLKKVKILRLGC